MPVPPSDMLAILRKMKEHFNTTLFQPKVYEPITLTGEQFFVFLQANKCTFDVYKNIALDKDQGIILLNPNYFTLHVHPDRILDLSNPETATATLKSLTVSILPYAGSTKDFRTSGRIVEVTERSFFESA